MSQINRPPIGLQFLLGSKNFGENPSDLSQQVIPTLDQLTFFASETLQIRKITATSAGQGLIINEIVPLGEAWIILSAAFGVEILATGDDNNMDVVLTDGAAGTTSFVVANTISVNPNAVVGSLRTVWTPPQPFLVPGSFGIGGEVAATNLASKDYELDLVYYKLEI